MRADASGRLEAESIHILREIVAQAEKPVMLYSIGKDSAVMLRLAQKAFHPGRLPFPLLHVGTTWKFREMYAFRDRVASRKFLDYVGKLRYGGGCGARRGRDRAVAGG